MQTDRVLPTHLQRRDVRLTFLNFNRLKHLNSKHTTQHIWKYNEDTSENTPIGGADMRPLQLNAFYYKEKSLI
jgi:hypothetical protein